MLSSWNICWESNVSAQDFITMVRREALGGYISESSKVLEFGPYIRPTILNQDQKEYFVIDCFTENELKKYAESNSEDGANIPKTDMVIDPLSVKAPESLFGKFDLVIANHVFEHLIDPFRWLTEWEKVLAPNGKMILCIPDKKYSFDKFRSDTAFSHLLSDFLLGGERSISEHLIDCSLLYASNDMNFEDELKKRLNREFIENSLSNYQPGLHVHVFQFEVFAESILRPFTALGYTDMELTDSGLLNSIGEFFVILSKVPHHSKSVNASNIFLKSRDSYC